MNGKQKLWYLWLGDEVAGPYSALELRDALNRGDITKRSLVFQKGTHRWQPLGTTPTFAKNQHPPPPTYRIDQDPASLQFDELANNYYRIQLQQDVPLLVCPDCLAAVDPTIDVTDYSARTNESGVSWVVCRGTGALRLRTDLNYLTAFSANAFTGGLQWQFQLTAALTHFGAIAEQRDNGVAYGQLGLIIIQSQSVLHSIFLDQNEFLVVNRCYAAVWQRTVSFTPINTQKINGLEMVRAGGPGWLWLY